MARLAGKKGYYEAALLDPEGNPTSYRFKLYSVTNIIDKVVAKPQLLGWYWKTTMEGLSTLAQKYGPSLPSDLESLKSLMSTEGLSPYKVRDSSGARGTKTHTEMEALCKGKVVKANAYNQGLLNWWEERNLTKQDILGCEVPLFSPRLGVAGTVDMVYVDPVTGATVLCDLKTGKTVPWTNFLQGEAYRLMADEADMFDGIDKVSVLHVREVAELENGWEELVAPDVTVDTFMHILAIFNALPYEIKNFEEEE